MASVTTYISTHNTVGDLLHIGFCEYKSVTKLQIPFVRKAFNPRVAQKNHRQTLRKDFLAEHSRSTSEKSEGFDLLS